MLQMIKRWGHYIDSTLTLFELSFVGAAMVFSAALLFVNVVLRYVFLAPISWAEEVTIYLMIWIVFIGSSAIVRQRAHLAIDLVLNMLNPKGRRALMFVAVAATLLFFCVFIYYSGMHTLRIFSSGQVTPNLQAPMWLTYLAMPVGGSLMLLRSMQVLFLLFADDDYANTNPRILE